MRQDLLGAALVSIVSTVVVLATYRPEKNEGQYKKATTIIVAALFAFALSFVILFLFFTYSIHGAPLNVIRTEPNF